MENSIAVVRHWSFSVVKSMKQICSLIPKWTKLRKVTDLNSKALMKSYSVWLDQWCLRQWLPLSQKTLWKVSDTTLCSNTNRSSKRVKWLRLKKSDAQQPASPVGSHWFSFIKEKGHDVLLQVQVLIPLSPFLSTSHCIYGKWWEMFCGKI